MAFKKKIATESVEVEDQEKPFDHWSNFGPLDTEDLAILGALASALTRMPNPVSLTDFEIRSRKQTVGYVGGSYRIWDIAFKARSGKILISSPHMWQYGQPFRAVSDELSLLVR